MKFPRPILSTIELQHLSNHVAPLIQVADLAFVLQTAANGMRLRLLVQLLANADLGIADLSAITGAPPAEIADHLAHLARAGLVKAGTSAGCVTYRPGDHPLVGWLRTTFEEECKALHLRS